MYRPLPFFFLCLLSACSVGPTPTPVATPSLSPLEAIYRATDLGTLGGNYSHAYGVSADGTAVVGYSGTLTGEPHAFVYRNGTMSDLGTLGGSHSFARAVSADGQTVAGESVTAEGETHAFIYRSGVMKDLGTLGGSASYVRGVSADGSVIVGESTNADGQTRAFVYREGSIKDLGTLGGATSVARGVSADGSVVVGFSADVNGYTHAFVHRDGVMQDLGTLESTNSYAWDVSADGSVIVGYNMAAGDAQRGRAFVYRDGVMRDLGTLGGTHSVAYDVSADGETVVGFSLNADGKMRAFAAKDGVMKDLGTLAGLTSHTSYARGVSADGRVVVGYSRTAAKEMHATLWRVTAKAAQTVTFTSAPPPSARVGGLHTPTAAASSGLGVTFGASGACVTEPSSVGSSVRLTGVGTCTVTALQAGSAAYEAAAATQTFGVTAAAVAAGRYLIDFERTPVGRLVYRVDRSSGLVYLGGGSPRTSSVPVVGRRRSGSAFGSGQRAVVTRLWGSDRLTVASPGTAPDAQGGRLELSFANFGPAGVTLTSLKVSNLMAAGAYSTLSYAGGGTSRHPLGTTSAGGSLTVTLNARRVTRLAVFAPSAFALDDVAFTDEAD